MKAVFSWIKSHVWETITSFCAGLAVIFGLAFLFQRKQTQKIRDEGRISMVKGMVKEFQRRSDILQEADTLDDEVYVALERERKSLRKEIKDARDVGGMTDEEVLESFERLGY